MSGEIERMDKYITELGNHLDKLEGVLDRTIYDLLVDIEQEWLCNTREYIEVLENMRTCDD